MVEFRRDPKIVKRGPHGYVLNAWKQLRDRRDYHYNLYTMNVLIAMKDYAEKEVACQVGTCQDSAREWSGLNAINAEIKRRVR